VCFNVHVRDTLTFGSGLDFRDADCSMLLSRAQHVNMYTHHCTHVYTHYNCTHIHTQTGAVKLEATCCDLIPVLIGGPEPMWVASQEVCWELNKSPAIFEPHRVAHLH
jgi:hypothetical protein